jgi:Trypsin-like peptidase domain
MAASREGRHMFATANVYERVVKIVRADGSGGTGMVVEHAKKTYVITARHVLPSDSKEEFTVINRFRTWKGTATPLAGVNKDADVAVFSMPDEWAWPQLPIELNQDGVIYSQDVLFFGYPYGLSLRINGKDSLPFVKKATLSATDGRVSDGLTLFCLDGINNPGFSGGPVVVPSLDKPPKVCAIVHGFQTEWVSLHVGGAATAAKIPSNTGIILAYGINHALEALQQAA